ncbi:putative zinc finger protein [Ophiocordyceps camponoti-floridani]|uniref:Putative zinc finger protein n=1 Tax=Ophiocordyceps camponoti-floridani TaxID=2030778 RepID=A0A8H4Q213_9HYPO|nr:putative zinc finger protein [Ophiocordyceps camponoti-floridani]
MTPNRHFECGSCGKEFPHGCQARDNHCSSTGHSMPEYECDTCHRFYKTERACFQHMDDCNHWNRTFYKCGLCDQRVRYLSKDSLVQHEYDEHDYCSDCDRIFQNYNNLRMHLNSRAHRGSSLACPFCGAGFVNGTGIAHHLEAGSCSEARGLNRDQMYRFVRSKDPNGVISKKLLEWTGSVQYEATANSYNGSGYECYLCHNEYSQLRHLTQHLNSPRHQSSLYHCPNSSCRRDFKTLAGIINHFESESCGVTRFDKIQRQMDGFLRGQQRLEF